MTYIPNPDKPCEADEINRHIVKLYECKKNGTWDMEGVLKWLKVNLVQMADANDCMVAYFDELYPEILLEMKKEEAA
jgi:hypothetical protein